ncbi:hypothetical protein EK21DRAFT_87531 [Setomelanomma holmii]|uniref:Uncharacterized protein n=1 Tax=Setomelanomma holmii TaxID=210430 RepID=A0A9P4HBZ6_9PLEO|nr:hypothetical protein EK21DRAFT_87531 [Setomelanomma holmii]
MCRFTRIRYKACKHDAFSKAPHHTALCDAAESLNNVQGFDTALAFCYQLSDNEDSMFLAEHKHNVYGYCDGCREKTEVAETTAETMRAAQDFENLLSQNSNLLDPVEHEELRTILLQPGLEEYELLYLNGLSHCKDWLLVLQGQMQQRVPRRMFDDLMRFTERKMEHAVEVAEH